MVGIVARLSAQKAHQVLFAAFAVCCARTRAPGWSWSVAVNGKASCADSLPDSR